MTHLTSATLALSDVFSVAAPGEGEVRGSRGRLVSAGGAERVETEAGLVLTPHGRWQLVQGLARGEARYGEESGLATAFVLVCSKCDWSGTKETLTSPPSPTPRWWCWCEPCIR